MADIEKIKEKEIRKWIALPGKRTKKGKLPKSGGPVIINPKWEGKSGGRALRGYGRAYMKGGRAK